MRFAFALCAALLLYQAGASVAHAEDREARGGTSFAYNHQGQFGLYVQFGLGYRALFRYNENDFCGTAGSGVCTGFGSPWIELGLSYAPTNRIELITDFRIGLTNDFSPDTALVKAPRELAIAPGVKVYLNEKGSVKWFGTLQVAIDFTDYTADGVAASIDVGIRNKNGLLVDLHRTFGVYGFFGEEVSFVRWFRVELDFGVGMQARFP
jgi:hypothetical protein